MTPEETQNKIIDKVRWCISRLNEDYKPVEQLEIPDINFNLHGKTAGKAYLHTWEVRFNLVYANQNLDLFLKDTVPHEVAHLAEWKQYSTVGHKKCWKAFMVKLGVDNPKRCHSYDRS